MFQYLSLYRKGHRYIVQYDYSIRLQNSPKKHFLSRLVYIFIYLHIIFRVLSIYDIYTFDLYPYDEKEFGPRTDRLIIKILKYARIVTQFSMSQILRKTFIQT